MRISLNELNATLKRSFEGMNYFVGTYEDAAQMVSWLEMHGEQGFGELERALAYVNDEDKAPVELLFEDASSAIVDCHNRSALNSLALVLDLAHAKALKAGIATLKVQHCHNRKFILKLLADCGRRGISMMAYWQNGTQPATEHVASISAGEQYPHYSEAVLKADCSPLEKQTMTLICSDRVNITAQLMSNPNDRVSCRSVEPATFAATGLATLESGIEISEALWQTFNQLGEKVLVENTEASRQGAGGR